MTMSNQADNVIELADPGAPLALVTGLPGAGKTLYSLAQFAVGKQNVYHAGITGCTLPEWDATKWAELPPGSTLLIDEAQEFFPPRNPNADPPAHYVFNRIRHIGVHVVLITQHPNMLDSRVRRLCGKHYHLVNVFGAEAAMLHEFPTGVGDVDARTDSIATKWRYPRAVYSLYKSSTMHRSKGATPRKVKMIPWLIAGGIAATLAGLWWVWSIMTDMPGAALPAQTPSAKARPQDGPQPGQRGGRALTPLEYAASYQPRTPGLAHTAPRYDDLTKPARAPYPAACVSTATRCKCYSQDATVLDVPEATCRSVVDRGFFRDWTDPNDRGKAIGPTGNGQPQPPGSKQPGGMADRDELVALADQTPPVGQAANDGQVLRSMRR